MFNRKSKADDLLKEPPQPAVIKLGRQAVYPICPHCKNEINEILVIHNREESKHYGKEATSVKMCPTCKAPLMAEWS